MKQESKNIHALNLAHQRMRIMTRPVIKRILEMCLEDGKAKPVCGRNFPELWHNKEREALMEMAKLGLILYLPTKKEREDYVILSDMAKDMIKAAGRDC